MSSNQNHALRNQFSYFESIDKNSDPRAIEHQSQVPYHACVGLRDETHLCLSRVTIVPLNVQTTPKESLMKYMFFDKVKHLKAYHTSKSTGPLRDGSPAQLLVQTSIKTFPPNDPDSVTPIFPWQMAVTMPEQASTNRSKPYYLHGMTRTGLLMISAGTVQRPGKNHTPSGQLKMFTAPAETGGPSSSVPGLFEKSQWTRSGLRSRVLRLCWWMSQRRPLRALVRRESEMCKRVWQKRK